MKLSNSSFSILIPVTILLILLFGLVTLSQDKEMKSPADMNSRGEYLANICDCQICHSPKVFTENGPVPDASRAFSGFPADEVVPTIPSDLIAPTKWGGLVTNDFCAWAGPWGVSFAINLTPDEKTGIGYWDKETFIATIRSGKHMGSGRPILPPMPWPAYSHMTDEDLGSLFDYLAALPPLVNEVPTPLPPMKAPPKMGE